MHPKFLKSRYRLFKYRHAVRRVAERPITSRILDIGCGDGEYLLRLKDLPTHLVGLETSWPRLEAARKHNLDVMQASGTTLPYRANTFEMIYIGHVLHHVADYKSVLSEMKRCLAPDGRVFVIETTIDHPLLRLGRKIQPSWQGDEVEADWGFHDLVKMFQKDGWEIEENGRFNLIFFLWEMFPLAFWPFELFTPIFIEIDLFLARFVKQYSAHCYFVLKRPDK